ncbi:hypothetical protein GCM10027563_42700 [Parasphingorhabdus pacifica]
MAETQRRSPEGPLDRLRHWIEAAPSTAELVVATHSTGAALWLHHAATIADDARRADRVLLVAPPDPRGPDAAIGGPTPYPLDPMSLRRAGAVTRMVAGTGDPELPMHAAHALADELQIELDVILDGAHLDTAAGYGPWPAVSRWAMYGSVPLSDRFDGEPYTAGYSVEKLRLV